MAILCGGGVAKGPWLVAQDGPRLVGGGGGDGWLAGQPGLCALGKARSGGLGGLQ